MDRSRLALYLAGIVSLLVSAFALGAAATSSGDDGGAADSTGASVVGTADTAPPVEATARFDIEIVSFDFSPAVATVSVGTEVVWTNNDGFDHVIAANGDAFPASPNMVQGDTYSFVFTEPGTYEYICGIHPQMTGTIVVEA